LVRGLYATDLRLTLLPENHRMTMNNHHHAITGASAPGFGRGRRHTAPILATPRRSLPRRPMLWARLMMVLVLFFLTAGGLSSTPAASSDRPNLTGALLDGGTVLMVRHALAPGSGDPAHFRLEDCSTQRNLDARGRQQAREMGALLRRQGITAARIYASQWCRCLETARLMDVGTVRPLPALNSFFNRPEDRGGRIEALGTFLAEQPRDGPLIIMVTHYVTIAAMSGEGVSSGEGVLLRLTENGPRLVGRWPF
jgi:hypothetical protein